MPEEASFEKHCAAICSALTSTIVRRLTSADGGFISPFRRNMLLLYTDVNVSQTLLRINAQHWPAISLRRLIFATATHTKYISKKKLRKKWWLKKGAFTTPFGNPV